MKKKKYELLAMDGMMPRIIVASNSRKYLELRAKLVVWMNKMKKVFIPIAIAENILNEKTKIYRQKYDWLVQFSQHSSLEEQRKKISVDNRDRCDVLEVIETSDEDSIIIYDDLLKK